MGSPAPDAAGLGRAAVVGCLANLLARIMCDVGDNLIVTSG